MDQNRLSELIAVQIAELILSGKIENGTKLRQEELADMLEVSRIPVREAIQILQTQGLAERLATRHIITPQLCDENIKETYTLLGQMEAVAVTELSHTFKENCYERFYKGKSDEQIHAGIRTAVNNLYIRTLLENGYRYYVQYAEKQSHNLYHLMEVYDKTQESGNGSDRIQSAIKDHYQYLAEVVIQERKKG